MNELSSDQSDPFFQLSDDSDWNACIGPQGSEENYVDGYIEAAIELVNAVIDKAMYDKRDTLVMPILYTARHSIELALKLAIGELVNMQVIYQPHAKNHDILSHCQLLDRSMLGDATLRRVVAEIEPFISSLSQVDDDGQGLRYHENQDGQQSLADKPLVNLLVVRASLDKLADLLRQLKFRIYDLAYERPTGSYTRDCSRRDLFEIAKMLPQIGQWNSGQFDVAKRAVCEQFGIGSRQFSDALNVIKTNREMKALLGEETALYHLSDDNVLFVAEQWRLRHRRREGGRNSLGFDYSDPERFAEMAKESRFAASLNQNVVEKLSSEEVADLQTIYYMGRDKVFAEHYQSVLERTAKTQRLASDPVLSVNHLMEKTNFLTSLAAGIRRLGRPSLAERVSAL
ncbi:DUF3775 domain-containing protein [Mesorhizobium sp. BR1-1-13]|uniref:DUF3775 domain-containing protein n=1 Tax=Mesorhizobium sp. BR1-1-13 TaxID=2876656 RepID=UPI001CD0B88B|nr:DUF3775 domain-containing protein [Mesorhizobium sp. BR1-1-13]MBZ9940133.1 DUF3775 domain-containing protein [Mesorhizobium sp. BR1-1-13]